jgi:short chain dehydrogenase
MSSIDQLRLPSAGRKAAGAKVEGGLMIFLPLSSSRKAAGGHGQILALVPDKDAYTPRCTYMRFTSAGAASKATVRSCARTIAALVFAQELLAAGPRKVYAAARDPERITHDGVDPVSLDVTKPNGIAAATSQCSDVNPLINNAGISLRTGFLSCDAAEAARSEMETNYFGPLLLSRAFGPVLAKNGGDAIRTRRQLRRPIFETRS